MPDAQTHGAPQLIVIDQDKNEEKSTPKQKEQEVIQTLVNVPIPNTPTKFL